MVGCFRNKQTLQEGAIQVTRIDIDRLTEDELIDLNHRIISRLRFLRDMRSHAAMVKFRIGERVRFQPVGHPEITGFLTRYNKKSVSIIADNGQRWNVHPSFLSKLLTDQPVRNNPNPQDGSIIEFPKLELKPGS